jgi:ribosomal-protein-alanine N-acetyltransferase
MARMEARARGGAVETGCRVYLRRPRRTDEEAYLRLRRRSTSFLKRWEPSRPTGLDASASFAAWLRGSRGGRNERLLICHLESAAMLGAISLNGIIRGPAQSAFLGYWIGAPHARQGYMTEALQLALRHAFTTLGLHRVEANIMPANRASVALVSRAGFTREGYSPGYLKIAGHWEDHERWALLAANWCPLLETHGWRFALYPVPPRRSGRGHRRESR